MAFTCPRCNRTSYHPEDERQGYCGACNAFTGAEPRACAVCGEALFHDMRNNTWFHHFGVPDDHPAVPVAYDELGEQFRGRCDFCNAQGRPAFVLPVANFTVVDTPEGEFESGGDWAACKDCAALIDRNDWNGVFRRYRANWETENGGTMPELFVSAAKLQHRMVRKHVTGALRPLNGG